MVVYLDFNLGPKSILQTSSYFSRASRGLRGPGGSLYFISGSTVWKYAEEIQNWKIIPLMITAKLKLPENSEVFEFDTPQQSAGIEYFARIAFNDLKGGQI